MSFKESKMFTLILRKNNLTPFYHGGISPNYFEIILITLIPIIVYLVLGISKRKNLPGLHNHHGYKEMKSAIGQ
jgi:hypothetical protein